MNFASRGRRRTALAVIGAATLALCLLSSASSAAPPAGQDRADSPAALFPKPQAKDSLFGTALATSGRVPRARVNLSIPSVTAIAYAGTQSRLPLYAENGVFPVPDGLQPPNPLPQCNYYVNAIQNDLFIATVDEAERTFTSVGRFPDVRVATLGFGAIPITATLKTSQVVRDGKLVPIRADTVGGPASIRKSDPQNSTTYGCDPDWEKAMPPATISTGEVRAVFSDVRVDGQVVDVGSDCHTATPLQLRLIGEPQSLGGSYRSVVEGGTLTMSRDTRTTGDKVKLPLYPRSRNLTIPSFTGCRDSSGEDVSPLVSSLVSGPGATLAVQQGSIKFSFTDLDNPSLCSIFDGTCPDPQPNVPPPVPGK